MAYRSVERSKIQVAQRMKSSQQPVSPHYSGAIVEFLRPVTHVNNIMQDIHDSTQELDGDQEAFPRSKGQKIFFA